MEVSSLRNENRQIFDLRFLHFRNRREVGRGGEQQVDPVPILQISHHVGESLAPCSNPAHLPTAAKMWLLQEDIQEQVQLAGTRSDKSREQAGRGENGRRFRRAADNDDGQHHSNHDDSIRSSDSEGDLSREIVNLRRPVSHDCKWYKSTRSFLNEQISLVDHTHTHVGFLLKLLEEFKDKEISEKKTPRNYS